MVQLAKDRSSRSAHYPSSYPADWYIEDDEPVAQSVEHQIHEVRLQSMLKAWAARSERNLLVGCELAFRWDQKAPRVGVDPDVYVTEMPPRAPNGNIYRVRTWEHDNSPPLLAIEIVSPSRPGKDYTQSPLKHDYLGTFELWTFDPDLLGYAADQPTTHLQVFQRETNARLVRTYAGDGPVFSDALDAWVAYIDGELVVSNDSEGKDRWLTLEEEARRDADEANQRAEAEAKRAEAEAKRAEAEAKRAEAEAKRAEAAVKLAEDERLAKEAAQRLVEEQARQLQQALAHIAELEARSKQQP